MTVGGSGLGTSLLRRVIAAFPAAIDPASPSTPRGLEIRSYVPELYRHLAVCDLAVVQGGLTTCMELAAARRPFLYVPLRNHFEQNFHVTHRLDRYRAGRRLDPHVTPEEIAVAITEEIGRCPDSLPVSGDGARTAARMLAELL